MRRASLTGLWVSKIYLSLIHICELSGTKLPANYRAIVEKFADDPEALKPVSYTHLDSGDGRVCYAFAYYYDRIGEAIG